MGLRDVGRGGIAGWASRRGAGRRGSRAGQNGRNRCGCDLEMDN